MRNSWKHTQHLVEVETGRQMAEDGWRRTVMLLYCFMLNTGCNRKCREGELKGCEHTASGMCSLSGFHSVLK